MLLEVAVGEPDQLGPLPAHNCKGEPFSYLVDFHALVGDFLDAIGAGQPVQQDGKLVYVGRYPPPEVESFYPASLTLVRTLPGGELDPSFGIGGITVSEFTWFDYVGGAGVGLQSDQHFIVVGTGVRVVKPEGLIARSTPDGQELVKSGFAFADSTHVQRYEILPDDNVVVSGDVVFGDFRSYYRPDLSAVKPLNLRTSLVQSDGKTVYGGSPWYGLDDAFLVRHDLDNSLDAGFGGDGFVTIDVGGDDRVTALMEQPDGSLLATGTSTACPNGEFSVVVHPDGSYDPPECLP